MSKTLLSLLIFFGTNTLLASSSLQLSMCVGGYCTQQSADSPLAGTGNRQMDRAHHNLYRHGHSPDYHAEIQRLRESVEVYAERRRQLEKLSTEDYQNLVKELKSQMFLPELPSNLISSEDRRLANPLPQSPLQQGLINDNLDEIWGHIDSDSPHRVVDSLNRIWEQHQTDSNTPAFIAEDINERRKFLEKELIMSHVINGDGLINAPYVEPYDYSLLSNPSTRSGHLTRNLFNQQTANKSLIRARCQAGSLEANQCSDFEDLAGVIDLQLLFLDRLAVQRGNQRHPNQDTFEFLYESLSNQIAFIRGFAHGAVGAYQGIVAMLSDIPGTAVGLVKAIYHYDRTSQALKEAVASRWDDFIEGDSEERSYILGQVSFEVFATLLPASRIGVLRRITSQSEAARRLMRNIQEPLFQMARQGAVNSANQARALVQVVRNSWKLSPDINFRDMVSRHADYFSYWSPYHHHVRTESALIVNKLFGEPAYLAGSWTYTYTSSRPQVFWRVHMEGNQRRKWLASPEDMRGLTATEIKNRFNLPTVPTHISEVVVPPGIAIRKGRVGLNGFGTGYGRQQFEVLGGHDLLNLLDYGTARPLQGRLQ